MAINKVAKEANEENKESIEGLLNLPKQDNPKDVQPRFCKK